MRGAVLPVLAAALLGLWPVAAGAQTDPPPGPTRYIAFGDSITAGVGDDDERELKGYPPRLETLLRDAGRDAVVANYGVGGERTIEGITRIDSVLREGGDVLLLMEGSNDISIGVSMETTLFNLGEMARRAETRGIAAVHATVIPRIPTARVDSVNLLNQEMNQRIREIAGLNGRRLVDNFDFFGRLDDRFVLYYWDDPIDGVGHPNGAGYDLMAGEFFDVITGVDSTPPVPGLMVPANGERNVSPGETLFVTVWDFGAGIDTAATHLRVNGVEVPATLEGGGGRATLTYAPEGGFANVVLVDLVSRDLATPANSTDRQVAKFIVAGTPFLQGDIDESGRVDGVDLVRLARIFGSARGEPRYNGKLDFAFDGVIDGEDLAILAANFGRSSF
jgi:lysophospholipase L1-like esterase